MLRKRTVLFTVLILLSLVMAPARHARAHTNPEGVVESAISGNDSYSIQANTNAYEPDNTAGQAKLITSGTPQTRSIVPRTDVDWIRFQLSATSGVVLETSGPLESDTRIYLYSGNLTELERNDDDGIDFYSYLDRLCGVNPLPAGTYYVKVEEYGNNVEIQSYNLAFDASPCPAELINIYMGDVRRGSSLLTFHKSTGRSFPGVNNGPVKVVNTGPTSLMASERVIYKVNGVNTSFSEMMGLPNSQLGATYYLPWYNNVNLDTQLRIANVSASPATVTVFIGGVPMQGTPFSLAAGVSTRRSFTGINNGPVQIASTQNIVAAERVIYKVNGVPTSFSEMMGLSAPQLDNIYWLPWYNNVNLDTQLRIANVTGSPATVQVFIGGVEMTGSPFSLAAGTSTQKSFPGINNGPVQIVSNQNIVAAARVIYKVNNVPTSFSEMMALPNGQLNSTYWFPWYNNSGAVDTQLRIANVTGSTATVQISIGGVPMTGSPFSLAAFTSTQKSFPGINNGPVKIESDQNIVAAERLIYKVNNVPTSFSEVMGLPNHHLDLIHWFPWYNNIDLDTQLRLGFP
jgi:hypothetical protein